MATSKIIEDMCNEAKIHGSIIELKEMKLSDDQIVTFLVKKKPRNLLKILKIKAGRG